MLIFPAIDLKDGQCVRLYKGDFQTAQKVAEDALETALKFEQQGAKWLHMVDLDGALEGRRINGDLITKIANSTKLQLQVGGGIRSLESIEYYLNSGVQRVILGSVAVSDSTLVSQAVKRYGQAIAVGIDAKDDFVRAQGWLNNSGIHYLTLAKDMADRGVETIIYTDISKDGTLMGPNLQQLQALQEAVPCRIIASGGVSQLADLVQLKALGLYGAICGQAIYKGTVDLAQAIDLVQGGDLC